VNSTKIIDFIKQTFQENGKASSKRATLFAVVVLLGYVVIRYTDHSNSVEMALVLTGLICSLVGITVYGGVKSIMKGDDTSKRNDDTKSE
jgi:propanediol dehydratase large subunit